MYIYPKEPDFSDISITAHSGSYRSEFRLRSRICDDMVPSSNICYLLQAPASHYIDQLTSAKLYAIGAKRLFNQIQHGSKL
jgi:hypothetical protein